MDGYPDRKDKGESKKVRKKEKSMSRITEMKCSNVQFINALKLHYSQTYPLDKARQGTQSKYRNQSIRQANW